MVRLSGGISHESFFIFLAGCFQRMQPYGSALRLANPKNQKKEDLAVSDQIFDFPLITTASEVVSEASNPNTHCKYQVISQCFQLKYHGILKEAFQEYI